MTAVNNLHMMSTNLPLDFMPAHPSHSRSNSVSSSSTHSSHSRPQSSHGQVNMNRLQPGVGPSAEDLYRGSYHLGHQNLMHNDSVRFSFPPIPCPPVNQLIRFIPLSPRQTTTSLIQHSKAPCVLVISGPVLPHLLTPATQTASTLPPAKQMIFRCTWPAKAPIIRLCLGAITLWPLARMLFILQEHSDACP